MTNASERAVSLTTVGCKLNQYETEGIAERFERAGFRIVSDDADADVCVVNTCTVTMRSDYRSRQMLRRGARRGRNPLVVATGCYAQREPDALADMPEVDLVVGNADKARLVELVSDALRGRVERVHCRPIDPTVCESYDVTAFRGHTRAFVKIQDGCDHRCTYCAVPDARGASRSRQPGSVVGQVTRLADAGYREVVLTGVHIGRFEDGEPGGSALARLVRRVVEVPGIERVRLGSIEPTELQNDLADVIVEDPRVCSHLHVPLQSGSDRILNLMGRRYGRVGYAESVRRVTDRLPRCGLGADVMIGFPGETDEDFADTADLIDALPFTYLHVFSYSPRPGTPAAELDGRVPGTEKRRRSRHLRAVSEHRSLDFRRRLVGERLEVLFEDREPLSSGAATGLSGNYVRVRAPGGPELANRLAEVRVTHADSESTIGEIVATTIR